jgi:paraquat-inducible protein B
MSKRANPTVIGAFIVGAVALAVTGILLLGGLQIFKREIPIVMFFDGDLTGLSVGSPLLFRGVQLGIVKEIHILSRSRKIAVYAAIDLTRLPKDSSFRRGKQAIEQAVKAGLRAQLKSLSIVTGQLSVSLDYKPDTPINLAGLDPDVIEIPTVLTSLAQLQQRLEDILSQLEHVDLKVIVANATEAVQGIRDLARSPELARAVRVSGEVFRSADLALKRLDTELAAIGPKTSAMLDDTRALMTRLDEQIEPLTSSLRATSEATRATVESAQGTLQAVSRVMDGETRLGNDLSQALQQLANAARSIQALAEYLERHPESLIRGKRDPNAK